MRLIQTIILILFTTSGLGATSTDIIDGLKGDYLCYGGGFDYKTEVVKDRYLYEELRKENPTCSIIPEIKNQKDEFKKNHYKILNYQIDPKCSEIASLIGQYKSNSLKTKNYINEVTPQRLDNIFSKTRRLDLDKGELVEVFKGTQIRSSSLAHLAVLCGASDVSVGVNPLWKLKVGLVENPVADTEIIQKEWELICNVNPNNFNSMCLDRLHLSNYLLEERIEMAKSIAKDKLIIQVCLRRRIIKTSVVAYD